MIGGICVLYLTIIIKSEVLPICHCIELGHETMLCTVGLPILVWVRVLWLTFMPIFHFCQTVAAHWISEYHLTSEPLVKCESDSKNLTGVFAKTKISLTEDLTDNALTTPPLPLLRRRNKLNSFDNIRGFCWSQNIVLDYSSSIT